MKMIFRMGILLLASILLFSCHSTTGARKPKAQAEQPPPVLKGKITIRWQNQSQEAYGFNIYRGTSRQGPFTKINTDIIPAAITSGIQKEFVFIDQPLDIGQVFYYYVESVSFAGQKEVITPVTKVVVKIPVTEPQEDPQPQNETTS